ncbi:MAG TPA: bifunctional glutamate N-acetyltransferase/amino-acid acetyltransferase ArgJ [Thermoleophilia bacterium]|nr:bifunctional glutamate N-acetyltransferase/amino-acid acetyltransferase ArgJ [Thermoleophilia bacterium]
MIAQTLELGLSHEPVILPESRFVELPSWVEQAGSSVTHPRGFRAVGLHAGLKRSGRSDLALLVSERPCTSAAVFTTNAAAAAPVRLTRASDCSALRGVVVNAGNANACTGRRGLGDAARMRRVAADSLGLHPEQVAVCSTGVIGVPLPIDRVAAGIEQAAKRLAATGGPGFAAAIRTTDRIPKAGALTVRLPDHDEPVRIGLAAKGAGMISPRMATTLGFVTTDAAVPQPALDDLLRRVVERSFNRVTVDGQQSTNDTVLCLANGASGVTVTGPALTAFEQALEAGLLALAVALVGDGEGATRTVRLRVSGARDDGEAEAVARAVGDSPLVKAAFFGADPNWGRVVQAAGQVVGSSHGARFRVAVAYGDVEVVRDGEPAALPPAGRRALAAVMREPEIDLTLALHRGGGTSTIYFSDLTHEYVSVNADQTS